MCFLSVLVTFSNLDYLPGASLFVIEIGMSFRANLNYYLKFLNHTAQGFIVKPIFTTKRY